MKCSFVLLFTECAPIQVRWTFNNEWIGNPHVHTCLSPKKKWQYRAFDFACDIYISHISHDTCRVKTRKRILYASLHVSFRFFLLRCHFCHSNRRKKSTKSLAALASSRVQVSSDIIISLGWFLNERLTLSQTRKSGMVLRFRWRWRRPSGESVQKKTCSRCRDTCLPVIYTGIPRGMQNDDVRRHTSIPAVSIAIIVFRLED